MIPLKHSSVQQLDDGFNDRQKLLNGLNCKSMWLKPIERTVWCWVDEEREQRLADELYHAAQ